MMSASGYVLRTLMPLTLSDDELDRGLGILTEAVETVATAEPALAEVKS